MKLKSTLAVALLSALSLTSNAYAEMKNVAITAIVEHPALDSIRKGVVEQLAKEGFVDGKTIKIDFQSAQGNSATAAQIARKFVGDKADIIIPITTPSAQPVVAATRSIPIVFSGVTDPVAAKLVKSWKPSGTNVTGVSSYKAVKPQLELIQKIMPNLKSLGYIYSAGEVNSIAVLEELEKEAKEKGIKIVPVAVQRSADIGTGARSLKGKVEAIYFSDDNGVVSAYEALHKAALEMKVPTFAADRDTVKRGAVACLATDQYDIGVLTGKSAAKVLKGEKAGTIPTLAVEDLDLILNKKTAKEFGITFSEDLVKQAKEVF